jgi:hypothetical protein
LLLLLRRRLLLLLPVGQVWEQVGGFCIFYHHAALLSITADKGQQAQLGASASMAQGVRAQHATATPAGNPPMPAHLMSAAHSGLLRSVARLPSTHNERLARVMATFMRRMSFTNPAGSKRQTWRISRQREAHGQPLACEHSR